MTDTIPKETLRAPNAETAGPQGNPRNRNTVTASVALVALIVGAVGGGALGGAGEPPARTALDATATIALEQGDPPHTVVAVEPRLQRRDISWPGTLTVSTADATLSGDIEFVLGEDAEVTPDGPTLVHAWGTATATLEGVRCAGTIGASSYFATEESGGAFQLRCADGSVLAGELHLTEVEMLPDGFGSNWEVAGFYLPAPSG